MHLMKQLANWTLFGSKARPTVCRAKPYKQLEKIVLHGTSEEAVRYLGQTYRRMHGPLLISAAGNGLLEKCKLLIDLGVDVNYETTGQARQKTPLHAAAAAGFPNVCELLIDSNAQVNTTYNSICTPLMLAARNHNAATVKLLIQKGAVKGTLCNKKTALERCTEGTATHTLLSCGSKEYVQCNEFTKAVFRKCTNRQRNRIMHGCIQGGHADEVALLLSLGVPPTARVNKKDVTAVQFAAERGTPRILYMLKEHHLYTKPTEHSVTHLEGQCAP
eukprot:TRINITY_DN3449_c0_g1_i1.p1 TRINITY_DN3449_c0_g1~~TRINITY_DN3449_c0_g1_i1.p1  ORF type:complete len:275 (+),score=58.18 TRINITY_DN3449_c0_g1_i1:48-872(+)